jgi:hypothetical protein
MFAAVTLTRLSLPLLESFMPATRRVLLVFALLIAGPAIGPGLVRASASSPDVQPQGSPDQALAAAFEQCWDLAISTLQEPRAFGPEAERRAADLESRIVAIVRGYPDPPALICELARAVEFGLRRRGNLAHLMLSSALANVLSDPIVRAATIWRPAGCPPETRRRLLKLASLRGGDHYFFIERRPPRPGHLEPTEIVGPLARASTPGEAWALSEAVLDQARANVRVNVSAEPNDAVIRGWCSALIEALREPATPVARFWLGWTLHCLLTPEADTISEDADAWAETLAAIPAGDAVPHHLQLRTEWPRLLDLFWAGAPMSSQEIWRDDDRLPADRAALEALVALNPHHPDLLGMHAVVCERLGAFEAADRSFAALADILGRDLTYAEYRFSAAIRHGMFSERRLLHLLEARQKPGTGADFPAQRRRTDDDEPKSAPVPDFQPGAGNSTPA